VSQEWQLYRERGTVFWLHVISWIALNIGWHVARALLFPITLYFFITGRATRRASKLFLGQVFGRPAAISECFRHHRTFASTILDRVYLLHGQEELFDIRTFGAGPVLECVAARRGCVLLGSHLGSFEILRVLGAGHEHFDLKVLMNEDQNRVITQFLNRFNRDVADTVISSRSLDAVFQIRDAIDSGALVALMGDRTHVGEKSVECAFFGKPARFPTTPASLALALGAPIFLVFGLYRGGNRYDVYFEPLGAGRTVGHGLRQREAERLTCVYASRLEHFAREMPYNWFNFYDFWKAG
jgi:predicted LPLAT superfamily acyltransferase